MKQTASYSRTEVGGSVDNSTQVIQGALHLKLIVRPVIIMAENKRLIKNFPFIFILTPPFLYNEYAPLFHQTTSLYLYPIPYHYKT